MVRKWSYINSNINNSDILTTLQTKNTFKRYKFKVFRATTRFKKYTIGDVTRIVRKLPIHLKRKTSLLNVSTITNHWVLHYLKLRQLNRFVQNLELFAVRANLPNILVLQKKNNLISHDIGVNAITCSKKVLKNLTTNGYFRLHGPYNTCNFVLTSLGSNSKQLDVIGSSSLIYDKHAYPINGANSPTVRTNNVNYQDKDSLIRWVGDSVNLKVVVVRKLITLLAINIAHLGQNYIHCVRKYS